jgi:hypothetical protein
MKEAKKNMLQFEDKTELLTHARDLVEQAVNSLCRDVKNCLMQFRSSYLGLSQRSDEFKKDKFSRKTCH